MSCLFLTALLMLNNEWPDHLEKDEIHHIKRFVPCSGWILKDSKGHYYLVNGFQRNPIGFPFHPSQKKAMKPFTNSYVKLKARFTCDKNINWLYIEDVKESEKQDTPKSRYSIEILNGTLDKKGCFHGRIKFENNIDEPVSIHRQGVSMISVSEKRGWVVSRAELTSMTVKSGVDVESRPVSFVTIKPKRHVVTSVTFRLFHKELDAGTYKIFVIHNNTLQTAQKAGQCGKGYILKVEKKKPKEDQEKVKDKKSKKKM